MQHVIDGFCCNCGKIAVSNENRIKTSYCEKCYLKKISYSQFKTISRWKELKILFDQHSICPYTGFKLVLGQNTSLDHILPKIKGGTNDICNLQFVYSEDSFDVNFMKGTMSEDKFKMAVKIIYENLDLGDKDVARR